jgi:glycosyltransferase involved in cell wall biosynthesis
VICHDIYARAAGVRLKKLYGCPIIYDSHELWPEADPIAENWEKKVTTWIERWLIRNANTVITVTPQIARRLEDLYGISRPLTVPNAEPFHNTIAPSYKRPTSLPLNFLYQGGVAPGRGIEELIELWSQVEEDRAILTLRAPENDYYAYLQTKFKKEINNGRIIISSPVNEDQLVQVACSADVGVIPYRGPNLNHIYGCPNKLSQYMQAGLAILCNADMEFVSGMIKRYECGLTYHVDRPESLIAIIQSWVNDPERLQSMKKNAYKAARTEFNWEVQSANYYQAIYDLYHRGD